MYILTEQSFVTTFSILSLSIAMILIFFSSSDVDSEGGLELTSNYRGCGGCGQGVESDTVLVLPWPAASLVQISLFPCHGSVSCTH